MLKVFSRLSRLENEARAMMDRIHALDIPGSEWIHMSLSRARTSAYRARFGRGNWNTPNHPRLLQAEQELKDAVRHCKAFNEALYR